MNYKELLKKYVMRPLGVKAKITRKYEPILEMNLYGEGFDDKNPKLMVENLVDLYKEVLHEDEKWHFFVEGDFTVIRFSESFVNDIVKFLNGRGLNDWSTPKEWEESTNITQVFQYRIFLNMFHVISESVMMLLSDEKIKSEYYDLCIELIAERMIHAWFNHNMLPAIVFGSRLKVPIDCQHWEAEIVGKLALDRASFGGRYTYLRAKELEARKNNSNINV